jgi:hypothetical protein
MTSRHRRSLLFGVPAAAVALASGRFLRAQDTAPPPARPGPLPPDVVLAFVRAAHADLGATRAMLDREARLVRAVWDWGGGDVETALGGASHMGRRDIALLLLDRGAPMDLFAAAMLGELAIVRAALEARPSLAGVAGPHGIPLIAHARAGGEPAAGVLAYLSGRTASAGPASVRDLASAGRRA